MNPLAVAAAVALLVAALVAVLLQQKIERRYIAALRQELARVRAEIARVQRLALSRRGPDGRPDEWAEREHQRLMAEYDARYEHLRAECSKQGLHLPEPLWRSP